MAIKIGVFKIVLLASLLGNVLLGWHLYFQRPPSSTAVPAKVEVAGSVLGNVPIRAATPWSRIEASSPERFAASLRQIGCPEHLIRNAQAAAIRRAYQKRARAFQVPAKFWMTADARKDQEDTYREAIDALDSERREALLAAVGPNAPTKAWPGTEGVAIHAVAFGFLSPEALEEAVQVFSDSKIDVSSSLASEEDWPEREAQYAGYEERLKDIMSAEERILTETFYYEMHLFDVWKAERQFGRKLDGDEKRQMMEILMPPDFARRHFFGLPMPSRDDAALQQEREAQFRETFGEEMFAHYRAFNQERSIENAVFPRKP